MPDNTSNLPVDRPLYRRHAPDLQGIAATMCDRAPSIDDQTLFQVGELLSSIAVLHEEDPERYADLAMLGYQVGVAWLMTQGRN